jgi:hypothetical protein
MTATDPHQPEISQAEKREILENDRRVRDRTTYKSFSDALANEGKESGRFSKLNVAPVVHPLPANSPWSSEQPSPGTESPTGYRIDQLEK